ncbi:cytochrome P450 CYP736A12-like [Neltuma alba]|uniref:cytochrome P450 CYP736A12-like n=1 Tax=Neltuma alba TaxID=207710 RepID=UPI0010A52233|nr:cytochrome P450 CYP736A12-like [Prosopis alba]
MPTMLLLILSFISFMFLLHKVFSDLKQKKNDQKRPPGPLALPVIGNLHMLGSLPHRTLQSLAKRYGPIMSLRLGQVPVVVVSSPEAAELFLKTHDLTFASRPKSQFSEFIFYGTAGMVTSEYGPYWRHMRKLCILQLLSSSKVQSFSPLRRKELGLVVTSLRKAAAAREVVNLSEAVKKLIEDVTYMMVLGRNTDDQYDLKALAQEIMCLGGTFNLADFVPWLGAFDIQGLKRRSKKTSKALDDLLEKIIKEHEEETANVHENQDFIDILLSQLNQPISDSQSDQKIINRTNIKAVVVEMIVAALETSATAIEWVFSELFKHPRVMKNLQDEIKSIVGMSRKVEEIDLLKFNYLDLVVKETFRLYPAGPLLLPRESRDDIIIGGYHIEKKSRVLINAWAIGRDSNVWSNNAETFYPERFMNSGIELQGQDYELIPFGSGRRGCPGIQLGLRTVKLVIAQLAHCFNWELPSGMSPTNVDMSEEFGLSITRANHLLAIPSCRLSSEAFEE